MEEKKRTVFSNSLTYGSVTGGAMIVYSLVLFIASLHLNRTLGWGGIVLMLAGMVWGTLEYRKTLEGGYITFGKAFQSCFMIGLFAGILGTVYFFIFVNFINPGFVNEVIEQARVKIEEQSNLTADQVEQAMIWTRKMTSPLVMVISGFVQYVVFSLILGLIGGLILKKNDPNAQTTI